jgi:Uma2 family endonuclease
MPASIGYAVATEAESGVREYWLVDPVRRSVAFLVNDGDGFGAIPAGDDVYVSPILPGVGLDMTALWREVAEQVQRIDRTGPRRSHPHTD